MMQIEENLRIPEDQLGRSTMRKVFRRLIPLFILMFCINFLDRVNIGFAALTMNEAIGITPAVFGLAGGIFFVTYTLFELPSNLMLQRVGARRWMSVIMIVWGICATANALVYNGTSLIALRALLGVAEGGFFPGLVLYMTYWFPQRERATAFTLMMLGSPISVIIGGPLSGALAKLHGFLGFEGWQWIFILEGLPAVLLGVLGFRLLIDGPDNARWLEPAERRWLVNKLEVENSAKPQQAKSLAASFRSGRVWSLGFVKFFVLFAFYGVSLWLPQIIKHMGQKDQFVIGVLSAIPYVMAGVVSLLVGISSDRTGERAYHIAIPTVVGAFGFGAAALLQDPVLSFLCLCVAATGVWTANALFWTMPTAFLTGRAAAAGIAVINMLGNVGSFLGPTATGWLKERTGEYTQPLLSFGISLIISAAIVIILKRTGIVVAARPRASA